MKVTIEVDCTPEEARSFMGLPDVSSLNQEVMGHMSDALATAMPQMDPKKIADMWMPFNARMMDQAQKAMMAMAGQGSKAEKE